MKQTTRGWRANKAGRRNVSWPELERAVLLRIAAGTYSTGQRLPTCEALASEFGANKNTASRAYRALAERGYVTALPGAGTFVSRRPPRSELNATLERVTNIIALAVQDAKFAGLMQVDFRRLVEEVLQDAYNTAGPRVGFIECNQIDATMLSSELQSALHHPIEPLLIEDVVGDPKRYGLDYDILVVNLAHLGAVEGALDATRDAHAVELVAVHIPMDSESLTRIARLRAGTRLGVVCDLEQTMASLTGLSSGCNPGLKVNGCLSADRTGIQELLESSDVIIVTPSAEEKLRAENPRIPVFTIAFRIDDRSVAELRGQIAERISAGATVAPLGMPPEPSASEASTLSRRRAAGQAPTSNLKQ